MPIRRAPDFLGSFTWATRPSGAVVGQRILVTDVGMAPGSQWVWSGSAWVPLNGSVLLGRTTSDGTRTSNNTTDTQSQTIASISFPSALLLAPKARLRAHALGTRAPNAASITAGIAVTCGASGFASTSGSIWGTNLSCQILADILVADVAAAVATLRNVGTIVVMSGGAAGTSSTVDTALSATATFGVTVQWTANVAVAETITLRGLQVELLL